MLKIDIHQAKTHFAHYVKVVAQGEEIIITKAGKPVARLAPLAVANVPRKLGLLDGKARIPDDFNLPLPDKVLAKFLGRC